MATTWQVVAEVVAEVVAAVVIAVVAVAVVLGVPRSSTELQKSSAEFRESSVEFRGSIDFHKEITANNHWLALGMIDVGRNDRAPSGNFVTNKFGRDIIGNHRAKALADYKNALALGGSRPLPELFQAVGAPFSFDIEAFKPLIELVQTELNALK